MNLPVQFANEPQIQLTPGYRQAADEGNDSQRGNPSADDDGAQERVREGSQAPQADGLGLRAPGRSGGIQPEPERDIKRIPKCEGPCDLSCKTWITRPDDRMITGASSNAARGTTPDAPRV